MTEAPWWRRFATLDPFPLLVGAVAVLVYSLRGFLGVLVRDSAFYVHAGQLVADGALPYEDLFNRAGPLAHLAPAVGVVAARLLDAHEVVGVRVVFMTISALAVVALYLLGRDVFASRSAGVAAAAAMLAFSPFTAYATYGPREKTLMVLLVAVALVATARQRWLAAGALVALATLTWQPAFLALFPGVALAALLTTGRWRALLRLCVGGVIVTVVVLAPYVVTGELRTFLDAFVLVNAQYTEQGSPLGDLGHVWRDLRWGYGWSLVVALLGGATLLVGAAATVVSSLTARQRPGPGAAALLAAALTLLGGVAWSLRAYDRYPDTFVLMPVAALGIGALAAHLVRSLPSPAGQILTATWAFVAASLVALQSVSSQDSTLLAQQRLVDSVVAALPPESRIEAVQAPVALVLSGQHSASRIQLFGNGMETYVAETWPGGLDGYAEWFFGQQPEAIAVSRVLPWFRGEIKSDYRSVGRASDESVRWFVRKDLGRDVRRAVRRAVQGSGTGLA
jgi:4-amino-4-deoxy-L-arabinose transferase-like glycosyltransferase